MARNLITRTVIGTKAEVKVVDLTNDTISTKEVTLAKKFEAGEVEKVKKAVIKALAGDSTLAVVAVTKVENIEKLYGITVEDFMAHAKELDPDTRKVLETEATTEAE